MKTTYASLFLVPVVAASSLLVGCVHILNQPQGKALSVTERGLGLQISYAPQSQSPEVKLGFFSSAVVILPTQTNGTVNTPNFANTFDFNQSGALTLGIGENIASGNYQTSQAGNTNSAITTQPILPK
jgi:hypothetical protein